MSVLKYEFKDSTPERKQEMLSEIISKYIVSNRNELVQALGHAQAILDCTQEEFSNHPEVSISTRQVRTYKKEYLDLYVSAFERYSGTAELMDVEGELDESALEAVYENLLARLKSPKTSTKDLAIILEYFGISKEEFKRFTDFRNSTMRGFMSDNLTNIVPEEDKVLLIKAIIAESPFLYQGTEKTAGNTYNAMTMDLDHPLVRLEVQTLGLLFVSLFNGQVTEAYVNHAEALRLLKLASGKSVKDMEKAHKDFDRMDGKVPPRKPIAEKDLIDTFGAEEGKELFSKFNNMKKNVDKNTAVKMPRYEDVTLDYQAHLKVYPEMTAMPFRVLLAKLDAQQDKQFKDKYKQFVNEINED
ncbi:hypothetical protein [Peribacillus sp. YIM B13482]|uniref:hypothetical protein n=1 Tax=Peribacillus sp. YIM B13482 TaxID=3366298 RepID=UPI00366D61D1